MKPLRLKAWAFVDSKGEVAMDLIDHKWPRIFMRKPTGAMREWGDSIERVLVTITPAKPAAKRIARKKFSKRRRR